MEKNNYCVYKHTFPNGKVYIGITRQKPEHRWGSRGKGYIYGHKAMFLVIQRIGWDNIKHEVLFENLHQQEAYSKEIELISFYDSTNPEKGYNLSGGGPSNLGIKYSEERRKKLSEAHSGKNNPNYGRKHSEEARKKMSVVNIGKKVSEETRKKLREAKAGKIYGRKHSEETKEKIRQARLGKKHSEESRKKMGESRHKPINQYDLNGNFIKYWNSLTEVSLSLNINRKSIYRAYSGKQKNTHGFIFKLAEDSDKPTEKVV